MPLIFQPLFFKVKKPSLPPFLSSVACSLYSPRLSEDWFLRYWLSFVVSSKTHFAIIHPHLIHANLYFIWPVSFHEWVVINLFNIFRHYKSPPFHTVIRIHLISLSYHILVLPSHFISMEQMLMLMLPRRLQSIWRLGPSRISILRILHRDQ